MKTLALLVIAPQPKRKWDSKLPRVPHSDTRGQGLMHLMSSGGSSWMAGPTNCPQGLGCWSSNGEMTLALPCGQLCQPLQRHAGLHRWPGYHVCQCQGLSLHACLCWLPPAWQGHSPDLGSLLWLSCQCFFMTSAEAHPLTRRESVLLKRAGDAAHVSAFLPWAAVREVSGFSAWAGLRSSFARGLSGWGAPCSLEFWELSHPAWQHYL